MSGVDRGRSRLASGLSRAGLGLVSLVATVVLLNTEVVPLGAVRAEDLASDYGLLTWNFWEVTESLTRGQNPYRTTLLYHPLGSNLATHTLGPGFFPVGLVAKAWWGGPDYPLYAHRGAILLCFSAGMLLAHFALRALGAGPLPALAAATGWAFAAFWRPIVANPTLASACMLLPATTLVVVRLVKAPSAGRAVALAVLVAGSVYFSEYFSAFILLALGVVFTGALAAADSRKSLWTVVSRLAPRGVGLAAAAGVLAAGPFLTSWAGSEGRPPKERQLAAGGANLGGFLLPDPNLTPLYRSETASSWHARVKRGRGPFLGFPTVVLAVVGAFVSRGPSRRLLLALAAAFFILSLGPVLKVLGTNTGVPLPYAVLSRAPPFDMARDPQRLAAFGIWAALCLAALGLTGVSQALARRRGPEAGLVVGAVALAWWAAEGYCPGLRPVVFTPPVQLRSLPPGAVANLPLTITDGLAMFLQVFHGRPILTGYVSRASPRQFAHVSRLQELMETDPRAFAAAMRSLGVGTLILQPGTPDSITAVLLGSGIRVLDLREGLDLSDARRPESPGSSGSAPPR